MWQPPGFVVLLGVVALMAVVAIGPVAAQGISPPAGLPKFRSGDSVAIPAGEVVPHDLYVTGSRIRHAGRIEGDLLVAGGQLDLGGTVTGDLVVAGGTVNVTGTVGGDVRAAGGQVTVAGTVAEDALLAGGTLLLAPTGRVGDDLIVTGGQVAVDGTVAGDVLGSAGTYTRGGQVSGQESGTIGQGAPPAAAPEGWLVQQLRRFVGIALIGALLLAVAPWLLQSSAAVLRGRPLQSLGVGVLGLVGFVVLLVCVVLLTVVLAIVFGLATLGQLLVTTVVGGILATGMIGFTFAVIAAFVVYSVVGLLLGRLAFGSRSAQDRWWALGALLLGVLFVVLVTAIPFVGPVLNLAVLLFGLGALVLYGWEQWRQRRSAVPAAARFGTHDHPQETQIPLRPAA
jgi:hypothetical protein